MTHHQAAVDVQWRDSVQNAADKSVDFGLKFLAFLAVLIVGWIVAELVAKLVDTVLERVGFDRAVERGGIKQALARSRYDASDLVSKLVYYAILLLTLSLAFRQFGPNPVSEMLQKVVEFLPKLLVAVIIIVVVAAIAKAVKDIVSNLLSSTSYGNVVGNVVSVFILGLGVVAALDQISVGGDVPQDVLRAVLLAAAGVVVVGVGGGLVMPMSKVWQQWIDKVQAEAGAVKQSASQGASTTSTSAQSNTDPAATQQFGATEMGSAATRPDSGESPRPQ